jgi:hypothetical protein
MQKVVYTTEEDDRQVEHYCRVERWQLLRAMQRIDKARNQLVAAQNNLVSLLKGMQVGREEFCDFYDRGGCTADDWQAWIDRKFRSKEKPSRGQLRLVTSTEQNDSLRGFAARPL